MMKLQVVEQRKKSERAALVWALAVLAVVTLLACRIPTGIEVGPPSPTPEPTATITLTPTEAEATATLTATPVPTVACPGAPPTQFEVGDLGRVAETGGPKINLRRDAVVDPANVIKLLADGTEFEITGGPVCAPVPDTQISYLFWEVTIPSENISGWIAEGDAAGYFIEPLP